MITRVNFLFIVTALLGASAFAQPLDPSRLNLRADGGNGRFTVSANTAMTPAAVRALEKDTFALINEERANAGLAALNWSEKIAEVARLHSNNMAENDFFSHRGLDGTMVDGRAARFRMGEWKAIGENIAFLKGYDSPATVAVQKWLQSASHRGNLLDPRWKETAIGLAVTGDGKYYFTQVFIR